MLPARVELSDRFFFTICMVGVHCFTFVYDIALHVVRVKGWFKQYELQKPRPGPDEKLVRACLFKNLRNHFVMMPAALYFFAYGTVICCYFMCVWLDVCINYTYNRSSDAGSVGTV